MMLGNHANEVLILTLILAGWLAGLAAIVKPFAHLGFDSTHAPAMHTMLRARALKGYPAMASLVYIVI